MKRTLCALLILTLVIAVPAFAVKHPSLNRYGLDDNNQAASGKQTNPNLHNNAKAITSVTIDTCLNIRATLSTNCRSIGSNVGTSDDTVQVCYLRGNAATYALWHAYSLNSGSSWTLYNVVAADGNNRPRYPTMTIAANDEGNSAYQCARILYHLQATDPRLKLAYESSSIGDNAWSFVELSDGSVDYWTPCMTQRGNQLAVSGQDYNGGGNGISSSDDGGQTWNPAAMALIDSFQTPGTQAALVWLNDTTLMGFVPEPRYDSQGSMSYLLSYDKGATWTGAKSVWPDGLSPQFRGSTWWYDYDAMVINGVPYIAFANSDWTNYGGRGYSAQALFVAHPTTPGDYTQWTIKHVSDMWDTATSIGFYPTEPALGADAAGNIYLSYVPLGGSSLTTNAAVIRSTDGGHTWSQPLSFINAGKANLDPFEISRTVGNYVYGVGCDSTSGSAKYALASYKIPVADIAAQPVISDDDRYMAPSQPLTGVAWTGDTLTDTMTVTANIIEWAWQPGFGFGGTYELTISQTPDWSVGASNYDLAWHPDSNDLFIDGMPATGRWYYKVRSIRPNASTTAWSGVYTFTYLGATVNTTDWVNPSGVVSKPVAPVYGFAVKPAYPNPAKDRATISYQLPKAGAVSLKVYNIAGQVVKSMDIHGTTGVNTMTLSTKDMSNGVYFYQVNSNGLSATRKMTVVR